jgi:6-phosphofructokinase 1
MVTVQNGAFKPMKFDDMLDPNTGKTRVRLVDTDTESYKIARRYMLRLRKDDFDNGEQLEKLAKAVNLGLDEFKSEFGHAVADEAPPIHFDV